MNGEILTVVGTALTVFGLVLSWKHLKLGRRQLDATVWVKPVVKDGDINHQNLFLEVGNCGPTLARDIRLHIKSIGVGPIIGVEPTEKSWSRKLPDLPPSGMKEIFIAPRSLLLEQPQEVIVRYQWETDDGKRHKETRNFGLEDTERVRD